MNENENTLSPVASAGFRDVMDWEVHFGEGEVSLSGSSSSSSRTSQSEKWKDHPIITGLVECLETRCHHYIEDRNPFEVASQLSAFMIARKFDKIRLTINSMNLPILSQDVGKIREDILSTIENEKYLLTEEDFEIK